MNRDWPYSLVVNLSESILKRNVHPVTLINEGTSQMVQGFRDHDSEWMAKEIQNNIDI